MACFVKQLGAKPVKCPDDIDWLAVKHGIIPDPISVHLKDKKGGKMEEWPLYLRVREMPAKREAAPA